MTRKIQAKNGDGYIPTEMFSNDIAGWGYNLWLNDLDDTVQVGNRAFSDRDRAEIKCRALDSRRYKGLIDSLDAMIVNYAAKRTVNRPREYIESLEWDGRDHIAELCAMFQCVDGPIVYEDGTKRTPLHAGLLRWTCNAVAKIKGDPNAAGNNFALVFSGDQGFGKSHFARWINPLQNIMPTVESEVNPDDKDHRMMRANTLVWELAELGATTKRRDVESLKIFLTGTRTRERAAYGRFGTDKPCICSFIGSVNDDSGGFLSDKTGNRRFFVVDVVSVNRAYDKEIDVNQVWAQAAYLVATNSDAWKFTPEEEQYRDGKNKTKTIDDPTEDALARYFEKTEDSGPSLSSTEIIDILRRMGFMTGLNHVHIGRAIASAVKNIFGISGKRSNGRTIYSQLQPQNWVQQAICSDKDSAVVQ